MTIKEAITLYNKNTETIKNLKLVLKRINEDNSGPMRDPLGLIRIEEKDAIIFISLLNKEIERLKAELEQEFE